MRFLQKLDFTDRHITYLNENASSVMIESIQKNKKLVLANLNYLKDLGVKNYQDIFIEYYDLFLLDNSTFVGIFNKYDREDLVDKLAKNVAIIEYL